MCAYFYAFLISDVFRLAFCAESLVWPVPPPVKFSGINRVKIEMIPVHDILNLSRIWIRLCSVVNPE